ncbi:MAG: fused signal recognition particle receptor [Pirellulaceae bacterium]|jgi:fused signal recognition particle receptor
MSLFNPFRKKPAPSTASQQDSDQSPQVETGANETGVNETGVNETGANETQPEGEARTSIWQRFKQLLNTDVRDLFKESGRLVDDEFLDELFAVLIKTDMGTGPANRIREKIHTEYRARRVEYSELITAVKQIISELLPRPGEPINLAPAGPTVVMVVGVNGSGKTTSIAKLSNMFQQQGKRVVLGAGDTFRAAAVEQLTVWAERTGAEIVKADQGTDPASVAHRAVARAIEIDADFCILDTAGRLQTQVNLMNELNKIRRVIQKLIEDAPHEVILVLDATAGQNGISQAQGFSEAAGCTGIMLAKLDGSAKGGVVIPICQNFNIPVKFIGLGEQADDIAQFDVDNFVDALFADG